MGWWIAPRLALRRSPYPLLACIAAWLVLAGLAGCGRQVGPNAAVSGSPSEGVTASPSPSSTLSLTPTATTGGWQTYKDPAYGFSIEYPPGFILEKQEPVGQGALQFYRVVEGRFAQSYPQGQIEFGVFTKDAETPAAWVEKHTGQDASVNVGAYFIASSNIRQVVAAGRTAVAFDWLSGESPSADHAVAFFFKGSFVFEIQWWAEKGYAAVMQVCFGKMLDSFKGE